MNAIATHLASAYFLHQQEVKLLELFREILDSIEGDIETLEIEKTVSEGEDVPTQAERSAIERVQSTLKQSKAAIEVELEMKG